MNCLNISRRLAPCLAFALFLSSSASAVSPDPSSPDYAGRKGRTLYVSKLGDDSDGSSWDKAYTTIQKALLAVPDDQGGHRVIIRPDTYEEANLYPSFKGAHRSYNVLIGDIDGRYGSGITGKVVLDTGATAEVVRNDPNAWKWMIVPGDPAREWGMKSIDWYGPWKSDTTFSGVIWDRWVFKNLYVTGSEAGMGVDLTTESGAPFSMIVENCVGIGRFAGAAVIAHKPRPKEPVLFKDSYFMNLDWWGDAGAAYVRGEDPAMPQAHHAVFENCTLVSPDNALQAGYPGVDQLYTKVKFKNCNLIVLNFSQPRGTPSSGVICCGCKTAQQLHVDFEDCTLMGFKIFGYTREQPVHDTSISYTVKGKVAAYVEFEQPVPEGMERLRYWPVEAFANLIAPKYLNTTQAQKPQFIKIPCNFDAAMENTPFIYKGNAYIALNHRNDSKDRIGDYAREQNMHLYIDNLHTGVRLAQFGAGHSFVNAFPDGDTLHVFASQGTNDDWFHDIYDFTTTDMKHWKRRLAIPRQDDEHLFNCSVARNDKNEYIMAYESNQPVAFCFKFARSTDLKQWEKIPDLVFTGLNNEYSACPVLRFFAPYYYAIYLHGPMPNHNGYTSFLARSKDLVDWQLSPFNPILEAGDGEGSNNSDVDLFEYQGRTYIYYATGDQRTWGTLKIAMYNGPLREFYEKHFPQGMPMIRLSTRKN